MPKHALVYGPDYPDMIRRRDAEALSALASGDRKRIAILQLAADSLVIADRAVDKLAAQGPSV